MALIAWEDKLSVNIKEIDEQHKNLINLVNEMHDAMKAGKGNDTIGKVLSGLVDYTKMHFATEERLMNAHGYPEYLKHKKEHDDLTRKAVDLQNQFQSGKAVLNLEVMQFLRDWLTKHIMGTDKTYGPFLNGKGIR
jgi:hemerythrin